MLAPNRIYLIVLPQTHILIQYVLADMYNNQRASDREKG